MTQISEVQAAIAKLEERIATLEAQRDHMADILFGLLDGNRRHAAALAVMYRFSEAEDSALQELFRWAFAEHQQQRLTAAVMRAQWSARMPRSLHDKLDQLIQAYRQDGELPWLTAIFDAEQQR